ncbi:N-acetyltransferase family protein [Niveibacterium sp.]|uniref:GNAT family N-acetyltransferase n=1 Tax=Niveibacterium sp. TaxID=2017444 RepID=UPI0035AE21E7
MTDPLLPAGCSLRRLDETDLPSLLQLYAAVMAALPDASMFRLAGGPEAFFRGHFGERGESLGVLLDGELVAYGALTLPRAGDRDNYANDVGWPAARAATVALLSAAMVAPEHRRLGLHGVLIDARIARAHALGKPDLLVRAAPANAASRQAVIERGFVLVWLGVQAEGSLRHVFWRPAGRPATAPAAGEVVWLDAEDLVAQQQLLATGWIGARVRPGDTAIGFVQAGP